MNDVAFAPALEQARLVREREISAVELVELYVERIERLDPQLNAYVTVDAERALAQARNPHDGAFSGVPISIKDLHDTAGLRTTYSSRAFAEHVPTVDTAPVRRIREAGFVILGKTNAPEFGTLPVTESILNGACRNPWDVSRTPGGSSGGAAAALAAGMCPIAEGGDGGGSIRIPAACCGLFGVKPERGRVSRAPFGAGLLGLSTSGPIARTVRDAAALLDVVTGYEPGDAVFRAPGDAPLLAECDLEPGALRIAVTVTPPEDFPVASDAARAALECAELLSELGHAVVAATPSWDEDGIAEVFRVLWQVGPPLFGLERPDLLEPINRALLDDALETSSVDLALAVVRLQSFARRVVAFWSDFDIVVTPALARAPLPIGHLFTDDHEPREQFTRAFEFTPFTPVVNVTGQAAAAVPWSFDDDGLPVGVQLIAAPGGEATLFRVAAQLEDARPWAHRRPGVEAASPSPL